MPRSTHSGGSRNSSSSGSSGGSRDRRDGKRGSSRHSGAARGEPIYMQSVTEESAWDAPAQNCVYVDHKPDLCRVANCSTCNAYGYYYGHPFQSDVPRTPEELRAASVMSKFSGNYHAWATSQVASSAASGSGSYGTQQASGSQSVQQTYVPASSSAQAAHYPASGASNSQNVWYDEYGRPFTTLQFAPIGE